MKKVKETIVALAIGAICGTAFGGVAGTFKIWTPESPGQAAATVRVLGLEDAISNILFTAAFSNAIGEIRAALNSITNPTPTTVTQLYLNGAGTVDTNVFQRGLLRNP